MQEEALHLVGNASVKRPPKRVEINVVGNAAITKVLHTGCETRSGEPLPNPRINASSGSYQLERRPFEWGRVQLAEGYGNRAIAADRARDGVGQTTAKSIDKRVILYMLVGEMVSQMR